MSKRDISEEKLRFSKLSPCRLQKRDLPVYEGDGKDQENDEGDEIIDEKKAMTTEFSDKTNQLLDYIEKTYLKV